MPENTPLSIMLESAKGKFVSAFNEVLADTKLPAYLVEGIVLEILADLRNRKNLELMMDYAAMQNKEKKE
ncbi:MAG: hypothetical protein E7595_04910 [Ruminococcaceae bacterium]|nr:hypothetical protein [Oscillospiraceae bacterium]